jgi:hypothetical protein
LQTNQETNLKSQGFSMGETKQTMGAKMGAI